MKDLVNAMRGTSHCDWCNDRSPTWWDRLMRFDQLVKHNERPPHERLAMSWAAFNTDTLPIWRLGRRWHFRYHANPNNQS